MQLWDFFERLDVIFGIIGGIALIGSWVKKAHSKNKARESNIPSQNQNPLSSRKLQTQASTYTHRASFETSSTPSKSKLKIVTKFAVSSSAITNFYIAIILPFLEGEYSNIGIVSLITKSVTAIILGGILGIVSFLVILLMTRVILVDGYGYNQTIKFASRKYSLFTATIYGILVGIGLGAYDYGKILLGFTLSTPKFESLLDYIILGGLFGLIYGFIVWETNDKTGWWIKIDISSL